MSVTLHCAKHSCNMAKRKVSIKKFKYNSTKQHAAQTNPSVAKTRTNGKAMLTASNSVRANYFTVTHWTNELKRNSQYLSAVLQVQSKGTSCVSDSPSLCVYSISITIRSAFGGPADYSKQTPLPTQSLAVCVYSIRSAFGDPAGYSKGSYSTSNTFQAVYLQ